MSLSDLFNNNGKDAIYPVKAIFINTKSKFADAPVIATDKFLVNIPSHMTDTCREILNDNESIESINNDEVAFTIYSYHNATYNSECFSIKFVENKTNGK